MLGGGSDCPSLAREVLLEILGISLCAHFWMGLPPQEGSATLSICLCVCAFDGARWRELLAIVAKLVLRFLPPELHHDARLVVLALCLCCDFFRVEAFDSPLIPMTLPLGPDRSYSGS